MANEAEILQLGQLDILQDSNAKSSLGQKASKNYIFVAIIAKALILF